MWWPVWFLWTRGESWKLVSSFLIREKQGRNFGVSWRMSSVLILWLSHLARKFQIHELQGKKKTRQKSAWNTWSCEVYISYDDNIGLAVLDRNFLILISDFRTLMPQTCQSNEVLSVTSEPGLKSWRVWSCPLLGGTQIQDLISWRSFLEFQAARSPNAWELRTSQVGDPNHSTIHRVSCWNETRSYLL